MRILFAILFLVCPFITLFPQNSENETADLLIKLSAAKTDTAKVHVLYDLSMSTRNTDRKKSTQYALQAIDLAAKSNYLPGLAKAYRRCANSYYYRYEFDSALYYAFKNLDIVKVLNDPKEQAKAEMNIGLLYQNLADDMNAEIHFQNSLELCKETGDLEMAANVYNNLGVMYFAQGNYEGALEYYYMCLKNSEQLQDSESIFITLGNIGGVYNQQDKNEKALEYYKQANSIAFQTGDLLGTAQTSQRLGDIFSQNGQCDSATARFEEALKIYTDLDDTFGKVLTLNGIGTLYLHRLERYPDQNKAELLKLAKNQFDEAIALNEEYVNDVQELIVSYQGLGEVNRNLGNYNEAIKYLNMVVEMSEEYDLKPRLQTAYEHLSLTYEEQNNYQKAYEYYVLFADIKDTLKNDANIELLTQMNLEHEFDKKQEMQRIQREQERKEERLIRLFILAVLLGVIFFAFQIFRSNQRRKKANILLAAQNDKIERQKDEITDSIKYAKRIQTAILPSEEMSHELLPEHFIYFRPRDIVSGDYYWMTKIENKVIFTAADCTGHGVPGAFMSMLGVSFLNEIVSKGNNLEPHIILNELRRYVKNTLGQTGKEGEAKDGMDIAMCVLDTDTMKLQYAGAYNPLYICRTGELLEYKADRMPIGIYIREKESFTLHEIDLQKGDTFYIFSDGFVDQFGGENGGKFKAKPFKKLLLSIQEQSMQEQYLTLDRTMTEWRGEMEQIDDIIVIGVRV